MEDERKKYIDCLLADFASIKEEIRRRATLQRFVLLGFAAVLAFTFKEAASNNLSAYWITGLWVSSFLALLFYFREGLEIGRLGRVIRCHIALTAARELRVERTDVFHSEHPESYVLVNCLVPGTTVTPLYDRLFNWIVFLIIPGFVTVKFIWPVLSDFCGKIVEHSLEAVLCFIAAILCLKLLLRHQSPWSV